MLLPRATPSADAAAEHAVVIGGSIAGLLAAHVLAERVARVTVVDRDELPLLPQSPARLPHGRHLHHLLSHGRATLERLFPGFADDMRAAGAHSIDIVADVAWLGPGGWAPRAPSGLLTFLCGRDLIETVIRRRVAANPRVTLLERHACAGLLAHGGRVTGVQLQPRGGGAPTKLRADLVVDASGRTSRAPDWLEALGYGRPAERSVSAFLGYASRLYALPEGDPGWKVLLIQSRPPHNPRTGTMTMQEHGRWIVTLAGAARDYPPTDEAGFLAFARSLHDPTLATVLERAVPLGPIVGFRRSANRIHQYERLPRWPEGLIVLGDAVCALNPYYAQGMTNAARGALTLAACLRHDWRAPGWGHRFQRRLAATNRLPWLLATGEDFRYPTTEGRRLPTTRLLHWFVDRAMARAIERPAMFRDFIQVMHMLKPPHSLLRPPLALQLFTG
jgi:2-polyprenyl-6-methoxyphenol hydroxylase-like FAD-dependent oxidoreductase